MNKPEEGNWEYLKKLVSDLRKMDPVFMARNADEQSQIRPADALASVRLKQTDLGLVLSAADLDGKDEDMDVTIVTRLIKIGAAKLRYENSAVAAKESEMKDRFGSCAIHVYFLPL